jgi:hypothetical protein
MGARCNTNTKAEKFAGAKRRSIAAAMERELNTSLKSPRSVCRERKVPGSTATDPDCLCVMRSLMRWAT